MEPEFQKFGISVSGSVGSIAFGSKIDLMAVVLIGSIYFASKQYQSIQKGVMLRGVKNAERTWNQCYQIKRFGR